MSAGIRVISVDEKSVALRRSLVARLNAADANLYAAATRRHTAEAEAELLEKALEEYRAAYTAARAELLLAPTPEARDRALLALEASAARGEELHAKAQRVRSELGTARSFHAARLAERAAAAQHLRDALPEVPAPEQAAVQPSEASS